MNPSYLTVRSLKVRSLRLGLVGVTDVVEFTRVKTKRSPENAVVLEGMDGHWLPSIVEYKRGKPKTDRSDEVQLCAQAMCLEEMLGVIIGESSLFYGRPRRRHRVALANDLRKETEDASARLHSMIKVGQTPPAVYSRKCRSCSLIEVCLPRSAGTRKNVRNYIESMLVTGGED